MYRKNRDEEVDVERDDWGETGRDRQTTLGGWGVGKKTGREKERQCE